MIYLARLDEIESFPDRYKPLITPGNYYFFTVSIQRSGGWEKLLWSVGLLDKIIYRSEPAWTYMHMERNAPSQFCVICKT